MESAVLFLMVIAGLVPAIQGCEALTMQRKDRFPHPLEPETLRRIRRTRDKPWDDG
jgi:hypothetical protein